MELQQLRYAVAVARLRNFSRAAEACHVSQPSLSQQILKLEEELGERLFHRSRREARLTPAGEAFLVRARRILEEVDLARRDAAETRQLLRGVLHVGVLPTIAPYFLPLILAEFTRRFPRIEVVMQEDTTARLVRALEAHELDLALASLPLASAALQWRELFREALLVALPPAHPLARKRRLKIADLHDFDLIVMQEGHCLGDQVLRFCDRTAFRPRINFRSAQLETVKSLVRAGLGFSLIPRMAVPRQAGDGPEYRPLAPVSPERSVVAAWLKGRPPGRAATEFLAIAAAAPASAEPRS
jgi:LysR family hydrogen peroxide-inducible transcriptional activator